MNKRESRKRDKWIVASFPSLLMRLATDGENFMETNN